VAVAEHQQVGVREAGGAPGLAPFEIHLDIAGQEHVVGVAGAVGAPEDGLHPRDELTGRERLGEVVVGAQLQAEHPVDLAVPRRQHENRDVAAGGPQPAAHLQSVDAAGQADVEDHHAGPLVPHRLDTPLAGRRLHHPEPVLAQVQLDQIGDVLVILDHHDSRRRHPAAMVARVP
jgi:hypothetical protein